MTLSGVTTPGVSLVVCTYNGAARLSKTLQHIARQRVAPDLPWELVVVDNASKDGSAEAARRIWEEAGAPCVLRIIPESRPGLFMARLTGVVAARYDYLCFIDDDNWISADWCMTVFRLMQEHPEVGVIGSRGEAVLPAGATPKWFPLVAQGYAVGAQAPASGMIPKRVYKFYGAGMTIRKSAFESLLARGFKPFLGGRAGGRLTSGDDSELCFAMILDGWRLWYQDDLVFKHQIPESRLTLDYLLPLYEGFGRSSAVQDVYVSLLSWRGRPSPLMISAYQVGRLLRCVQRLALSVAWQAVEMRRGGLPALRNRVGISYHLGRLRGIIETHNSMAPRLEMTLAWLAADIDQPDSIQGRIG